jgi:hypothetical protein
MLTSHKVQRSSVLGQLEPNLAGMFLGWSSTKLLFFVPVGYSTCLSGPIICSDWLKFQRSSSLNLKLMNWLNPNCKLMIIGMFFTKFLFFMWIGNPTRWTNEKHKKNTILCLPHTRYKGPRWSYDLIYMLYIIANTNSGHNLNNTI